MIIVEGPDNVGKTTLIEQLIELDPELQLIKRKRYNPNRKETIGNSYLQALLSAQQLPRTGYGIIDRLLASECIYGELFREGCRLTQSDHIAILSTLVKFQAIIVHCDAPDDVILDSWKNREQLYDDPLVIARAYRKRIHQIFHGLVVIAYDWTEPGALHKRKLIVDFHRLRNNDAFPRTG